MKFTEIKSCYVGPAISPEQFIPEHFFLYLAKGRMNGYDGSQHYTLQPGEYCLVRKNCLGRYNKQRQDNEFEKVIFIFDEIFLKEFQKKHSIQSSESQHFDTFIRLRYDQKVPEFVASLMPYYTGDGQSNKDREDVHREELLLLLLQLQPELSSVLFDFGVPGKINLEAFMNRNFRFNVKLERFAYLTGRSLSAFKRDFKQVFNDTPTHWLVQRRLEEARFLIEQNKQKSTDIYLDLGFEDLSHFSFAFKRRFGINPTELV
ncbi:AraC family transcriptional regulator [Cytophagaceae bacterium YF14B1]|uniref:AraC family transcriptional regulator n=1 Tax=Xanthocytophaga flava TaxID=3048013 RepID=A0AAE3QJQ3_9BACT|nr:AraC family transcriptional regulator [Xanthocytophaga flavus]MDJ1479886.1 AraC family transcriptional regulator [Xanthocytophaga flavus]